MVLGRLDAPWSDLGVSLRNSMELVRSIELLLSHLECVLGRLGCVLRRLRDVLDLLEYPTVPL